MAEERGEKRITVERVIAAPAEKIFDVLADPAQHAVIDGSGSVKSTRAGAPPRLSQGAKFGMSMRIGLPYLVKNTVVEFEENRRIGWWHAGHNLWLYELEPVDGGTRVRESFDWSRGRAPWSLRPMGFLERNRKAMEQTLERLDAHVTDGLDD